MRPLRGRMGIKMKIRLEQPDDFESILKLTYKAFLTLDYPGRKRIDEHYLISLLKNSPSVITQLCFVAEQNGEIVGHILYTESEILHPDGTVTATITFGPLSVHPEYHKQGIGSALVRYSMEKATQLGYNAVVITGVPEYYPKLSFKRAREYGLFLTGGYAPDAFMVYELQPGVLKGGEVRFLAPEFEKAETDDCGFDIFHRSFIKKNYNNKLIIRRLWNADVSLLEKWLYQEHVARWYNEPEAWLEEIKNRHGKFSFIRHFIAEINGKPIGFGQYYDCFFGQEYEEWHKIEKQGEIFSIDYLVGEPDALNKGYGTEIVRYLTSKAFRNGAKKVIVRPDEKNIASKRVLEANGYRFNGEDYIIEL